MSFLLDTCLLCEATRARPNDGATTWLRENDGVGLYASVLSIGEIEAGIARLADGERKRRLAQWLEADLIAVLGNRLLPVDLPVARRWGGLRGASAATGVVLPTIDAVIAATAMCHGLTVVTRNEVDFRRCGVPTLNPWT